mgnify:CR=1 FL=1
METPFNSRDIAHKSKFGAVASGEAVRFSLKLPVSLNAYGACLVYLYNEETQPRSVLMEEIREQDGFCWWECTFTGETGIYRYFFEYSTHHGPGKVMKDDGGKGKISDSGGLWQLTVYEKDFAVPSLASGVIYQVFPDRFFSSGEPKENVPTDRYPAQSWSDTPAFVQGEGIRVLNNDYYGGDLTGIAQKLPYLKELGITILYLNPIFEAHSNHRYNTADYLKVDPSLGTKADFIQLCKKAGELGIKVILDGVFSHTGSDSVYFNQKKRYPAIGAYNSMNSDYYSWYKFNEWPDDYVSWWGVKTLPEVDEDDGSFSDFIAGDGGVIQTWLRAGASGWRLDVADELTDGLLEKIRDAMKQVDRDAFLLGEVWENASNKHSYGHLRKFLWGKQLDSVMNYPFYNAIVGFLKGGTVHSFQETVMDILETYPPQVINALMNHIGTHDTERILTLLAGEPENGRGRAWQAGQKLSDDQRQKGVKLLILASLLQYTLPGIPSLYYGDEAGMEGYRDPFNRGTYPWGSENQALLLWYRRLGKLRTCPPLDGGEYIPLYSEEGTLSYLRKNGEDEMLIAVNRNEYPVEVWLLTGWRDDTVLMGDPPVNGILTIPPFGFSVMGRGKWAKDMANA